MAKSKIPTWDDEREDRIDMEIVVDAHDAEERAMGWNCYLDDTLEFPFRCQCIRERPISPLAIGDEVEVIGMAPGDECMREMFVMIRWERKKRKKGGLAVPLAQLEVVDASDATRRAVGDWHYWVAMGYEF